MDTLTTEPVDVLLTIIAHNESVKRRGGNVCVSAIAGVTKGGGEGVHYETFCYKAADRPVSDG